MLLNQFSINYLKTWKPWNRLLQRGFECHSKELQTTINQITIIYWWESYPCDKEIDSLQGQTEKQPQATILVLYHSIPHLMMRTTLQNKAKSFSSPNICFTFWWDLKSLLLFVMLLLLHLSSSNSCWMMAIAAAFQVSHISSGLHHPWLKLPFLLKRRQFIRFRWIILMSQTETAWC